MILGRDLPTALGLDLEFYENSILGGEVPHEGCYEFMVDIINYNFNIIRDKTVKPEKSFINSHIDECLESESAISATHITNNILDANYKKADLNKVMTKQCQHLNTKEFERILIILRK